MAIAENLLKIRKNLDFAQSDFALKLGIAPRAYINYERGERKPPYEMLVKLSDDFDVNLNWLINNKGKMFNAPEYGAVKDELRLEVLQILKDEGIIK